MKSKVDDAIIAAVAKKIGCDPSAVTIKRGEDEDSNITAEIIISDIRAMTHKDVMQAVIDTIEDNDG